MPEQEIAEQKVGIDVDQERNRPRVVAFLFFDFYNRTVEGKHNFLGLFDRIIVPADKKRTTPLGFYLRTANTFDEPIQVTIYNASNKPTGGFGVSPQEKEKDGQKLTQMQLVGAIEFETPDAGNYWVDVSYGGQSIGGMRLTVELQEPTVEPQESKEAESDIGSNNQSNMV
jgi:hypothetical protein